jgi:integrase
VLHNALHMPRVATKLTPTKGGGFVARKRIPEDAQEEYARLYGVQWEARFRAPSGTPIMLARAKHRDWLTEIESRIANIRARRNGQGLSLSPKDARALAGEWYGWYLERQRSRPQTAEHWEFFRDQINEALTDAVNPYRDPYDRDVQEIDDVWENTPEAREDVRPMLEDWCETAQFLAARRLVLDGPSRQMLLDALYGDFAAALKLLIRNARGDYTPDTHPLQFPKFEGVNDPGLTPWLLFERWVAGKGPAKATVDRWRGVFLCLNQDFSGRSAVSITVEEAQDWANKLVSSERTPRTVRDVWIVAARTVFAWAVDQRLTSKNPFASVRVSVPRKNRSRETKAFRAEEVRTILNAASAETDAGRASSAARRWVPWLCAYTGARVGEITQLRGADVVQQEGVDAIRITPEAGTVKTGQARLVPLHDHLTAQGFLAFAKAKGKGPLFYQIPRAAPREADDATNPRKPPYVKARERLAAWVRSIGVDDPELQPNHAWPHTFKQVADRAGITERTSDYITGHAHKSVGAGYGAPTLDDMASALKKFPRYKLKGS